MNFVYYTKMKAETTGFGSSIILRFISKSTYYYYTITTGSKLVNLKQDKKYFSASETLYNIYHWLCFLPFYCSRTHKTTDNQTEKKEKLYQQHFKQQCWEQRK